MPLVPRLGSPLLCSSTRRLFPHSAAAAAALHSCRRAPAAAAPPRFLHTSKPATFFKPNNWEKMEDQERRKYLQQDHDRVFEHNRTWAKEQAAKDPDFFHKLSAGQSPDYLWIGCSDSRIPAEAIAGMNPGEAFVHRNIANLVCNTDLNVMSVINYAVRHLHVKHIVVCGHYGCGGVKAAMTPKDLGLLNPWLRNIRDVYRLHEDELDAIPEGEGRYNRLVELNVIEQCRNIVKTAALQQSYEKGGFPIVHGWVFGFQDGLLKDLEVDFESMLHKVQKLYNLTD